MLDKIDVHLERLDECESVGAFDCAAYVIADDRETALSIAREVGLVKSINDIVLTHDEMEKMTDDAIAHIISNLRVVARALPTDKSRLVRICQKCDLVVGMTGDGVNDAPALKIADVGFSMGSGTEIAKESSDIVIMDDDISKINKAISISNKVKRIIKENLIFSIGVKILILILSVFGVANMWQAVFADVGVTIISILNTLRIMKK